MLVPYYKIPLEPFAIEDIVIGPTPHPTQSERSLKSLLVKHGLKTTKVRNTSAPFRNW